MTQKTYRDFIRTGDGDNRAYTNTLRRAVTSLLSLIGIVLWGAFTTALVVSPFMVLAGRPSVGGPEFYLITCVSALLVMFAVNAREMAETLSSAWLMFEDGLGRLIVFGHSATHTFLGAERKDLRWGLATMLVAIGITAVLMCLKWTLAHLPVANDAETSLTGFIRLVPESAVFFLGVLFTGALAGLIMRYSFSRKWHAIYAKPTFTALDSTAPAAGAARVDILHASDLHITGSDDELTIEGRHPLPEQTLKSVLQAISHDAQDCAAVLMTGDLTDAGSSGAWERFLDNCPRELVDKMLVVPGNHDINLQDHRGALKAEKHNNAGRRVRQLRALAVMTEVMQDRPYVMDRHSDRIFNLKEYFERNRSTLEAAKDDTNPGKAIADIWDSVFPMVVPVGATRAGKQLGIIILDSVKPSSIGLTNAVGAIPYRAIQDCITLMNRVADKCDCFAFALHHHVAMPAGGGAWARLQNAGLVFENASNLIDMLARRGDPTVVFHGHRHVAYSGVAAGTNIAISAAPSATIGKGGEAGTGSWHIVTLACAPHACRVASEPEVRRLSVPGIGAAPHAL